MMEALKAMEQEALSRGIVFKKTDFVFKNRWDIAF
eukprot:gene26648-biopygen17066